MLKIKDIVYHARHANTKKLTEMGFWGYSVDLRWQKDKSVNCYHVSGDQPVVGVDLSGFEYDEDQEWYERTVDRVRILIHKEE